MTRTVLNAFACLFPLALLAPAVHADATLTMQDAGGKMDSVIEVKDHMVRMSTPGEKDYVLIDTQREVAIHVSESEGHYIEIDQAAMKQMADSAAKMQKQMAPQMAKMREQLKNMPPEQRAMIEQRMGAMADFGAMESRPPVKVTTVKRGKDKIAGFKCQRYDVLNDKVQVADVCMATKADAGMSKADFATVSSALKFMRDMAESAQEVSADFAGQEMMMGDVEGLPVSARDLKNGREFHLVSVADDALDDARFNAYHSLSKQELPTMH